jgi:hypothetical protein
MVELCFMPAICLGSVDNGGGAMVRFRDAFTGVVYEMGQRWITAVRQEVAQDIERSLQPDNLQKAADATACFWRDTYYERLFPLRFGLSEDDEGFSTGADLFEGATRVNLDGMADKVRRKDFLDGNRLPPILPATEEGDTIELLADRVLTQAVLANLLLRQGGADDDTRNAVRLACLTYPLLNLLEERLKSWAGVAEVARFLRRESPALPGGLEPTLVTAVRDLTGFGERKVGLGLLAVQRIKHYVFETPRLNEIRGASTLLDKLTEVSEQALSEAYGPEVVLRAVGATLVFLAPSGEVASQWVERLRRAFYMATGTAFAAGAATEVAVDDLLTRESYRQARDLIDDKVKQDRAVAAQPTYEALPFEARCRVCRIRPAEGWEARLPGEPDPVPLCRVCKTKRELGLPQRKGKAEEMLQWLHLTNPAALGVEGKTPEEYVAQALGRANSEEKGFIPPDVRRPLVATIYGDGNNFGAVGENLLNMSLGLQWSQRVLWTTRAAAAVALARATQETADDRGWKPNQGPVLPRLPFQVLALGGDDLSLFAWGPVGVRFARDFTRLTNLEFKTPEQEAQRLVDRSIAFSTGMLITDYKAAVRRTVDVAEHDLLKWAKQAFRERGLMEGSVAPLLAVTQEQVPDDLKVYRWRMYTKEGPFLSFCLTLRPFSAEELAWLVQEAEALRDQYGSLHRLVAPFVQSNPLVAMLHYIYQRARASGQPDHWLIALEDRLEGARDREGFPQALREFRYPAGPSSKLDGRRPFGLQIKDDNGKSIWFTPLYDLLELVKVLG